MGCGSTPSLSGLWIPRTWQVLPLTWTTLAQPEGRAFLSLIFQSLQVPQAHSHPSLHQCRCREVAVPCYFFILLSLMK